ncbi:hypothetical protein [Nocardia abscessus]|uniref:hypothetical protein n=1 Tax=Nocardia abscessus TaxID=120957 RepID=UPI0024548A83|nr:hypothetical protein [Nocardia abscessus]
MNGWVTFAIGLGAALVVMVPVVAASMWWKVPTDREAVKARVAEQRMDNTLWAAGFPHDAPDHELGVEEAHRTMQRHRNCDVAVCRRKRAAWQTLVDAKRIRPDASRQK